MAGEQSVLESLLARMTGLPPTGSGWDGNAAFPGGIPATDPVEYDIEGRPNKLAKAFAKTDPVFPAPPTAALPGLTQQAGILAPGIGSAADAAAAAAAQPPEPAPTPAPGTPLPVPRPAAADVAPADAALPPNATPTDGRNVPPVDLAPQQPAAAPAAAPSSPYSLPSILDNVKTTLGNNSNTLLALGAGFAGAPNWGQGISRAASAAIPARAADIKQQLTNQTQYASVKAMRDAGVPPSLAQAALGNPAIMKSVVENYLGDRKGELKEITLPNGTKMSVLHQPYSGKITDLQGNPLDASGAAMGSPEAAAAAGLTGEEYLKASGLSENDMMNARKVANYELDPKLIPPRGNNRERIIAAAEHYDPDFQQTLLAPRMAAIKEFTSGGPSSPSSTLVAGRTAINHFGKLSDISEKIGGTDRAWIFNKPANWTREQYQEYTQNPELQAYKVGIDRATEEATKFYRGIGGNKSDIDRGMARLSAANSPDARRAAIAEEAEFMQSKIDELQNKWKTATGPRGWKTALQQGGGNFPILSQQNEQALERIRTRRAGQKAESEAAPAAAPAVRPTINGPNGPMILSEDGKSWQPMH